MEMTVLALWSYTLFSSVILEVYLRVWSPSPLKEFGWFLEAISLKRTLEKEQSEEALAATPSTFAWGSDQDQRVLYLIPIWASLWTQWCSICAPSHSLLVPAFNPAWWLGYLVWPWAFLLSMDLMGVCWTLGWSWPLDHWAWSGPGLIGLFSWLHLRDTAACACLVMLNSWLAFYRATCPCCFLAGLQ